MCLCFEEYLLKRHQTNKISLSLCVCLYYVKKKKKKTKKKQALEKGETHMSL